MTEQEKLEEFHKDLNNDKGLKSKRQLVTYISLVILAINLSGATIQEANTFLFKIEFMSPEGLNILLACTLFFGLIRYYNYSHKYTKKLTTLWKGRFLSDSRVLYFHNDGESYYGILSPFANKVFMDNYADLHKNIISNIDTEYKIHWLPFYRTYKKSWQNNQHGEIENQSFKINKELSMVELCILIKIEYSYRIEAYFKYPETLDLKAPFLIASLAYISILMKSKIPNFINFLGDFL